MKSTLKTRLRSVSSLPRLGALAVALATAGTANAGVTVSGPGESYLTLGLWMRTSFTSADDGAPNGTSRSMRCTLAKAKSTCGM